MIQQTTATTRGANPLIGSVSQHYFPTVETRVRRRVDGVEVDATISTRIVAVREERARALPQHILRRHLAYNERKLLDPAVRLVFVEQPDRLQRISRRHLQIRGGGPVRRLFGPFRLLPG